MSETAAAPAHDRAADERIALDRTWGRPAGLYGRLCAADHKTIGIRYLVTAFCFFLLAGLLAAAMRLQLSRPENRRARPRRLQPGVHDARHHHDVPVRGADHA